MVAADTSLIAGALVCLPNKGRILREARHIPHVTYKIAQFRELGIVAQRAIGRNILALSGMLSKHLYAPTIA
jgi:hypothetical protein